VPGIALTESRVSAKCCHLVEKNGDKSICGIVIIATAFEALTMPFKDLIKASISQS